MPNLFCSALTNNQYFLWFRCTIIVVQPYCDLFMLLTVRLSHSKGRWQGDGRQVVTVDKWFRKSDEGGNLVQEGGECEEIAYISIW